MSGITWGEIFSLFGPAIAAALIAGLVCPLVGCLLLVRRTGFYGVTLPQFAAAGVAFGFVVVPWWERNVGLGVDAEAVMSGAHTALNYHLFWALLFTFAGLMGLVLLGRNEGTETARVAAAFAIASALTILLAHSSPAGDIFVHELLRGEILAIGRHELEILGAVLAATLGVIVVFHRDLVLISYDPETAIVLGKSVRRYSVLLQILTGATVATTVMTTGPVVLFGLLVVPPLAARILARSMVGFFVFGSAVGLIAAAVGVWLSFRLDWPLGPAVVVAATVELALVWGGSALRQVRNASA